MNELHALHDFFAASVGSAAALIGLLFVAISVAPEKVFGIEADLVRRANAERTFTALADIFFVSLVALLAHDQPRAFEVVAVVAMLQTLRAAYQTFKREPKWSTWRHLGIVSFVTFGYQFSVARGISANGNAADEIVYTVLGLYFYALITSWELMRAPNSKPHSAGAGTPAGTGAKTPSATDGA